MSGYVIGAGLDISSACDIRICSKETKFTIKEVDIGLCADIGTT
jgi:delta(3,5)-delta(2,4)-dienoyl-CoA isomerase